MRSIVASLLLLFVGIALLLAPTPYYLASVPACLAALWVVLHEYFSIGRKKPSKIPGTERFKGSLIGKRFCRVQMNGCMAETRGKEHHGTIVELDYGRTLRGLIYCGGMSKEMLTHYAERGQDTWLMVAFDDGSFGHEPIWWCHERADGVIEHGV